MTAGPTLPDDARPDTRPDGLGARGLVAASSWWCAVPGDDRDPPGRALSG
ncbi:hypothetical protein CPER28S_01958 [Cellulomonas persica]